MAVEKGFRTNERIRSDTVLLVPAEGADSQGAQVVPTHVARDMARELGLDLVEVNPGSEPPVCRILNYGKFKYERFKKKKESRRRNASSTQVREVSMMPFIFENDLNAKMRRIKGFLTGGVKVKVSIVLKGRMQSRPEAGVELLNKIKAELEAISTVGRAVLHEGRTVSMILTPVAGAGRQQRKGNGAEPDAPSTE